LERNSKVTYTYDNIPLQLFIHIAKTGEVELLNAVEPLEAWEEIISRNCAVNEIHDYKVYLEAMRSQAVISNEYMCIKAHLIKLSLPVFAGSKIDMNSVEYLEKKGYKINLDSKEAYIESLRAALKKKENLLTRINMKTKEIERMLIQNQGAKNGEKSIEELLASLSFHIGFSIPGDVTLARFNEYTRMLRRQAEISKAHGRNK
jgi:glutaredoxin 2